MKKYLIKGEYTKVLEVEISEWELIDYTISALNSKIRSLSPSLSKYDCFSHLEDAYFGYIEYGGSHSSIDKERIEDGALTDKIKTIIRTVKNLEYIKRYEPIK